jgi:hypothetical protein
MIEFKDSYKHTKFRIIEFTNPAGHDRFKNRDRSGKLVEGLVPFYYSIEIILRTSV